MNGLKEKWQLASLIISVSTPVVKNESTAPTAYRAVFPFTGGI